MKETLILKIIIKKLKKIYIEGKINIKEKKSTENNENLIIILK